MSGSFISSSPKLFGQGTYYFKPGSAISTRAKMEYTGENKTKYQDLYPDNDSTVMKTTTVRKGPILLKCNPQSSEVDESVKEENFNESIVYQNQSGLGPVYTTEKVGSDDDGKGQTDAGQGQVCHSSDKIDLDYTINSFESPLSPVNAPLHLGTSLPDEKAEATNIEVSQSNTMMPSHKMSILGEKLIIGEYTPINVLIQPSRAMPSQNNTVSLPDIKMFQPHTKVSLQITTLPKSNMDTEFPIKGMSQVIRGVRLQPVSTTSSQPTSPPPQSSLRDSMTLSGPPVGSHPPQGDFSALEMQKKITGHRLLSLGQIQQDGDYVKTSQKPKRFEESKTTDGHERMTVEQDPKMKNIVDTDKKEDIAQSQIYPILTEDEVQTEDKDYVENINDPDKKNSQESQRISHEGKLAAEGGYKSEKKASSNTQVDSTEICTSTSFQETEDDAERFFSLDSEGYARIKEIDDSDDLAGVYRETTYNFKPLKPRLFHSAEFPLPPTPEVEKRPFSNGDVDNQRKTGQPNEEISKLSHEKEDAVSKLKLPDPVELKDLNPHILKFLVKNEKHRLVFEKNLSDIYAVAKWPSSLEDRPIIKCTVKVNDKNASSLLKDWNVRVVDKVENIASGIEVAEFNIIQVAWPRVYKELENICVDNPEDVGVFIEQDRNSVTLVGPRGAMEKLKTGVLDMIDMVIAQIKHEKQRVTETKQMKTYAIILLGESDFKQEIKKMYPGLQIDLNLKEKTVIFIGQVDIVQEAVVQMHEKLQSFVNRSMQMSKAAKGLLFAKEVTDYIKQKMKSQQIFGVWDVVFKEEVRMFALDEGEVQKAIQLVNDCLVEKEISLDDAMAEIVKGQQWLQQVERIQEKHKQKVAIETSMKSILVVAQDDIFQDVFNKIKDYLQEHSVKELVMALNLVKIQFIKRYKMEDIKALEKKFESLHVKLLIIDYGDQQGIKINGTNDGCKVLQTALAEMAKNVITKEHTVVSRVGLKELFQCFTGREQLNLIEVRRKCLLEIKDSSTSISLQLEGASGGFRSEDEADENNEPTDRQSSSDSGGTTIDACGIKVSFVQGELAEQMVDVIVNSTNHKLDLGIGAISKTILKYGGDSIQRECWQQYSSGLNHGKVAVTSGGLLKCKKVYHGCLKVYDGGKGNSLQLMKTFIKNCLKEADKSGYRSMAFPALGTGQLGFPADEVGKLFLQCIQKFGKKTPKTSLKEISLVVFPLDIENIKAFTALFVGATVPSANKIKSGPFSSDISMVSRFPVAGKLFRERSRQNNLVFCITIDSESNFKAAVKDLEGFIKNELTEKEINYPSEIISKLHDVQVTQIEGMGQGKAIVSVNRKKGVIRVSGTQREVVDTYDNLMKYLHKIERV